MLSSGVNYGFLVELDAGNNGHGFAILKGDTECWNLEKGRLLFF